MPTSTLDIIIRLKDQVSASMKGIDKSLDSFKKDLDKINKASLIVTGALVGVGVAGFKLAESAGKYASVKDAFQSMTEGMGFGVEEFENRVANASAGTLDKLTILRGGTRALSLMGAESFSDFGTQFTKMAELSKKAARATGMDVTYMFDSLITGMSRESKMILDNLGITVDLVKAKEDYAITLGKEASELTITEEKTAVLNHTLGKLEENYADVAVSAGGLSGAVSRMKAVMADSAIEIGEVLDPVFNELIRTITPLITEHVPRLILGISNLIEWFRQLSPFQEQLVLFFVALAPAMTIVTTVMTGVITMVKAFLVIVKPLVIAIKFLGVVIGGMSIAMFGWILVIAGVIAVGVLLWKNWEKIREVLTGVWNWLSERAIIIFNTIIETLKGWAQNVIDIFTTLGYFYKGILIVWKEFLRPIWQPVIEASEALSEFLMRWLTEMNTLVQGKWTMVSDTMKKVWAIITTAFGKFIDEIKRVWADTWDWVVEKVEWASSRIGELVDRIKNFIAPVTGLISSLSSQASNLGVSIGEGIGGFIEDVGGYAQELVDIGAGVTPFSFATGGIVPGPIGAPVSAIVHGGETIIPVGSKGIGANITINITGNTLLDEESAEKMGDLILDKIKRNLRL